MTIKNIDLDPFQTIERLAEYKRAHHTCAPYARCACENADFFYPSDIDYEIVEDEGSYELIIDGVEFWVGTLVECQQFISDLLELTPTINNPQ